jgi:hypothetical protein
MPGLVTSMDVAPPNRTENSGINVSRTALIFFRLVKSESHLFFSSKGCLQEAAWAARSCGIGKNKTSTRKVRLLTRFFTFKKERFGSPLGRNTNHQQLPRFWA